MFILTANALELLQSCTTSSISDESLSQYDIDNGFV